MADCLHRRLSADFGGENGIIHRAAEWAISDENCVAVITIQKIGDDIITTLLPIEIQDGKLTLELGETCD